MGYGAPPSMSDLERHYASNSHIRATRNIQQVYTSKYMPVEFDPSKMKLPREARDSNENPNSRGIIFACDLTGSMDIFLMDLIQNEVPRLIRNTFESVQYDPQICFMGFGDVAARDDAPLQVTQFETDIRILQQLQNIYVERGGGGNRYESYILPWYFAANHISMDCFEKRGKKGFLFTFGDEEPTPKLTKDEIKTVFGENSSLDQTLITSEEMLEIVSEKFYCYHIMLHAHNYDYNVVKEWKNLLGSHVCDLSNHHYLPELIATILKMYEGKSKEDAILDINDLRGRSVVEKALSQHEDMVEDVVVDNGKNTSFEII